MKNEKYNEQRCYERAAFYGGLLSTSTKRILNISRQKTWLMFVGLIETADIVEYNDE